MLRSQIDIDTDSLLARIPVRVVRREPSVPLPLIGAGAALAGALAMLLLDPAAGRRRRHLVAGRLAGIVRRGSRRTAQQGRHLSALGEGVVQRAANAVQPGLAEIDDNTLTAKVMSEVFAGRDVPKGSIDVNSEHGVVVLRGEVRTPELVKSIEARVRAVDGVREVRNLLHLPKTPAPQ